MREVCNVVHRTVLTRPDSPAVQASALQVLQLVLICATEKLEMAKRRMLTQELGVPANKQPPRDSDEYRKAALLGEGGEEGNIDHATSVIFAALEVCFCVLIRYHPDLSPGASGVTSTSAGLIGRSSGNSHSSRRRKYCHWRLSRGQHRQPWKYRNGCWGYNNWYGKYCHRQWNYKHRIGEYCDWKPRRKRWIRWCDRYWK